jgi:hypothetical protein
MGNAAVAVSGQDTASIGHVPYYNYLARSHEFFSLCPRTRAVTETNYHRRVEYEGYLSCNDKITSSLKVTQIHKNLNYFRLILNFKLL